MPIQHKEFISQGLDALGRYLPQRLTTFTQALPGEGPKDKDAAMLLDDTAVSKPSVKNTSFLSLGLSAILPFCNKAVELLCKQINKEIMDNRGRKKRLIFMDIIEHACDNGHYEKVADFIKREVNFNTPLDDTTLGQYLTSYAIDKISQKDNWKMLSLMLTTTPYRSEKDFQATLYECLLTCAMNNKLALFEHILHDNFLKNFAQQKGYEFSFNERKLKSLLEFSLKENQDYHLVPFLNTLQNNGVHSSVAPRKKY